MYVRADLALNSPEDQSLVCGTSLLKTLWKKEKLLVTSNFTFFHIGFLLVLRTFYHFRQIWNCLQTQFLSCPGAKWWACHSQDLVIYSSIPGRGDFSFRRIFASPLQKHVRKGVGGFGKKSCVSTGVRKPRNIWASPAAMIWPSMLKWR